MRYRITLNRKIYEVEVERGEAILKDEYDAIAPMPAAAAAPVAAPSAAVPAPVAAVQSLAAGEVVEAPLPGNILEIKVSQGAAVKKGEILLLIEAMKMENEIVAPRDGTVTQIVAQKGATVDTGAPLVVLG